MIIYPGWKAIENHLRKRSVILFEMYTVERCVLVILTGVFAATAVHNLKSTTNNMYQKSGANDSRNASSILKDKKPVSILIMGTDTGALGRHYKGRTDTMMIMTINPKTDKTTLLSIPRDMEVNLPDFPQYSPAKINSAYTYGGVKEAINSVESHFKIPIDYYFLINMGGLEKAINDVGGVTVTSPLTFSYLGANFVKGQAQTYGRRDSLEIYPNAVSGSAGRLWSSGAATACDYCFIKEVGFTNNGS